jgi:hypothetical protein
MHLVSRPAGNALGFTTSGKCTWFHDQCTLQGNGRETKCIFGPGGGPGTVDLFIHLSGNLNIEKCKSKSHTCAARSFHLDGRQRECPRTQWKS